MYILNIVSTIKKMAVKKLKDFIFKNYHQREGFAKKNSYYSMRHQKKKDVKLFATKLIEKTPAFIMLKKTINLI